MTRATGVGSLPGEDFTTALKLVLDELPDLPHLPELPGRGVTAGMVGRTLGLVTGIGVDLQPAGWRLTDAAGIDHRRARSLIDQDLDGLEEHTQGYTGSFKVQVCGPWTLAATVEKPRGDKVLSDVGARRDLAQALAESVRDHVRDLRRRMRDVDQLIVQVDEPGLAAVLGGRVPTASGFGRHRTVHPPEASEHLEWLLAAIADEGAEPWVHSCSADVPWGLLRGAGARGLVADLSQTDAAGHDVFGEALESGDTVVLGLVSSTDATVTSTEVVERVLRWLDMLGLDLEQVHERLLVSGTCGYSGASTGWAREAMRLSRESASSLS
ncbi:MAG: methionine synthase [Nocardioides sp.]